MVWGVPSNDDGSAVASVEHHGQVVLLLDLDCLRDVQLLDLHTFRSGLLRDQLVAKHLSCNFDGRRAVFCDVDSSL